MFLPLTSLSMTVTFQARQEALLVGPDVSGLSAPLKFLW